MVTGTTQGPTQTDEPVPLSELRPGEVAKIRATRLSDEDTELLRAMGLDEHSTLRVCRSGEPCIVLAGATRVGISSAMTQRILVARAVASPE